MGTRSRHYIRSLGWYERNALQIFENTYGLVGNYSMLAYLPNYYQNPDSSLIHMVCDFMEAAGQNPHKSFIKNHSHLSDRLSIYLKENKRVLLFGVSFALLDYAIHHKHVDARNLTVIETGGMKRFAAEITRAELHRRLSDCFVGAQIHSEYGMTECLSQLYSTEGGSFKMNDRMRALIGDPSDPRAILDDGNIGQVQIIDLANIDTLSFIRTDDLGKINTDGTLEILGRANASDLRGCNYLI